MGGMGGTTQQQTNPTGFAGSRSATAAGQSNDFSSWLASIPGSTSSSTGTSTSTGTGTSTSPLVTNPTATPTAFTSTPQKTTASTTPIGATPTTTTTDTTTPTKTTRKAPDNVRVPYGVFYFNNPESWKAIAEITNSIRAGYDRKDYADMIPYVGNWRPDKELQEYMDPSERTW